MDESDNKSDLGIRRLSLIDVSSEDDWLLNSPYDNQKDQTKVLFLEATDDDNVEVSVDSVGEVESTLQPLKSPAPEVPRKNEKYNLRKSLAWDSAFFTSAGFLDPEELSSMIGTDEKTEKHSGSTGKSEKQMLPAIQEAVHRSTDSMSTLDSDTLTLESSEVDLFEDIRASIQKSSKALNMASSDVKVGAGITEAPQTIQTSKKANLATRNKLKPKAAPKKPGTGLQGSGKIMKQVPVTGQVSQSIVKSGVSAPSVSKPPKVLESVGPISTISIKRASLGANRVKMERDNASNETGRMATLSKAPALGSLRNIVPRPTVHSRSSLSSSTTTNKELRTSYSSFESSDSASSGSITQSSFNSLKKKNDVKMGKSPSSSTAKTPRSASRNKNQSGSSHLSAHLSSVTKLSPSISPASSVSEWSAESSSSASTVNLTSSNSKTTSSCKRFSVQGDKLQVFDSFGSDPQGTGMADESVKRASTGTGVLRPPSVKPTGLRMPSPKIGFFDGMRSSIRTPNGATQSLSGLTSGLPKVGSGSISPSGGLNKVKHRKLQATRTVTAIRGAKPDAQQTASGVKSKSPSTSKELSNAAMKVSNALRNVKGCPPVSPKFQSRASPKIREECELNAREFESREGNTAINDSHLGSAEKNMVTTESKGSCSSHGKRGKNAEMEKPHLENQVDGLIRQVGVVDGNAGAKKELAGDLCSIHQVNVSREDTFNSPEQSQPSKFLVCSKKEELPSSKLTSLSPAAMEVTANPRIPLATKDSFCNSKGLRDVSTGLTVGEAEKTPGLSFPQSTMEENR